MHGETIIIILMREDTWAWSRNPSAQLSMTDFERGAALARFVDKASFGGDGKQAQVSLRMHHAEGDIAWLLARLPPGRLYGPYEYTYKDGGVRRFYQLMYRGDNLREHLLPFLDGNEWSRMAPEAHAKYLDMRRRYRL